LGRPEGGEKGVAGGKGAEEVFRFVGGRCVGLKNSHPRRIVASSGDLRAFPICHEHRSPARFSKMILDSGCFRKGARRSLDGLEQDAPATALAEDAAQDLGDGEHELAWRTSWQTALVAGGTEGAAFAGLGEETILK
jgi:hypothetical protein